MVRLFTILGSLLACTAVAAGAFGAHALRGRLDADMLGVFEVGARYQMYHALALVATAWALSQWPGRASARAGAAAGWCFVAGIALFSGSLYALALTGVRAWGAVTPFGGAAFLAGWICLAVCAWRAKGTVGTF